MTNGIGEREVLDPVETGQPPLGVQENEGMAQKVNYWVYAAGFFGAAGSATVFAVLFGNFEGWQFSATEKIVGSVVGGCLTIATAAGVIYYRIPLLDRLDAEIEELDKELEKLRSEISALQSQAGKCNNEG